MDCFRVNRDLIIIFKLNFFVYSAASSEPPSKLESLDPRSELVDIALSDNLTAAVESGGQVNQMFVFSLK